MPLLPFFRYIETLEVRLAKVTELLSTLRPDIDLVDVFGGPLAIDPASFSRRRPAIKVKLEEPSASHSPSYHSSSEPPNSDPSLALPPAAASMVEADDQKGKEESDDACIRGLLKEYRPIDSSISFMGKVSGLPALNLDE